MEKLAEVRQKAKKNAQKAQNRQKMYFDKKHRDVYEVGDQVMLVNRILSSAVSEKLGPNFYEQIDEEGDIVPRVPTEELKPAFLDEQLDSKGFETDKPSNPETAQRYTENEQISPGSQGENTDQTITDTEPRIAKHKRGRPRKTRVVVKREESSKFDKRAKATPELNKSKIPEPVHVVKLKRF